jgi:hypothetical protein
MDYNCLTVHRIVWPHKSFYLLKNCAGEIVRARSKKTDLLKWAWENSYTVEGHPEPPRINAREPRVQIVTPETPEMGFLKSLKQ